MRRPETSGNHARRQPLEATSQGEVGTNYGLLIAASRPRPDPERRLLQLQRFIQFVPENRRKGYWPHAAALAERGGDDAQLMLLGFVRTLSPAARPQTFEALHRAVRRVQNTAKRTLAFIALAEITSLSAADVHEAVVSAARIPDRTLRIMTLTRLSQLEGRKHTTSR